MAREIGNLSLLGFVDGITSIGIVFFSVLFGLITLYHARKLKAKLLAIAGLTMICLGAFWIGPSIEFFLVLLTGNNYNPEYLYGWICYMWIAPGVVVSFYLGAELMVPEKKKIIVGIYGILGIIFEILLFGFVNQTFIFKPHGEGDLTDSGFNWGFPAAWLIGVFLASLLIFLVIGFAIKAKQATGELRKKFSFLSLGFLIFFICGMADALFIPGIYLAVWRGAMMTFAIWMYLGLKT